MVWAVLAREEQSSPREEVSGEHCGGSSVRIACGKHEEARDRVGGTAGRAGWQDPTGRTPPTASGARALEETGLNSDTARALG